MKNKPLILIADDDPDDQYFFQEAMEVISPLEAEVYFVWDGSKLLSFLGDLKKIGLPDRMLIVLDLNMQVKNGQSTLIEMKRDPAFAGIPVVILTTSSSEADREHCLRHGAAAYYRKPEAIGELVEIVRSLYHDYLE
jgi:CheY-like chemotaxis protein